MSKSLYIIGSLRNPEIPKIGCELRRRGFDVFDDWFAAGPEADDKWREYEESRGNTYKDALSGYAARHVYSFDVHHLNRCDVAVLVLPSGRSAHLELGWFLGQGKPGFVLMDTPDRWDVMYKFATNVCFSEEELFDTLSKYSS